MSYYIKKHDKTHYTAVKRNMAKAKEVAKVLLFPSALNGTVLKKEVNEFETKVTLAKKLWA